MGKRARLYQTYIIVGMVLAIIIGAAIGLTYKTQTPHMGVLGLNLGDLGGLFIQILKLIVIPLIVTSMVAGVFCSVGLPSRRIA